MHRMQLLTSFCAYPYSSRERRKNFDGVFGRQIILALINFTMSRNRLLQIENFFYDSLEINNFLFSLLLPLNSNVNFEHSYPVKEL